VLQGLHEQALVIWIVNHQVCLGGVARLNNRRQRLKEFAELLHGFGWDVFQAHP
jgi:hypothetical protein